MPVLNTLAESTPVLHINSFMTGDVDMGYYWK